MTQAARSPSTPPQPATLGVAIACLVPTLVAYNLTPAATLFNNLAALAAWGLVLAIAPMVGRGRGAGAVWVLLALLGLGLLVSAVRLGAFSGALLATAAVLLGAGAVLALGLQADVGRRQQVADGLGLGWLLVGVCGVAIGAIQVFAPAWPDAVWIARSGFEGRAVGNVRQPNHLATLLLCAAVAAVWCGVRWRWRAVGVAALLALMVAGVVLTASRTGLYFGVPLLVLWGLLDRQLPGRLRLALLATPLKAAAAWWGLHLWAEHAGGVFGAEVRLDSEGAGSPSRVAILRNTLSLIADNPWGVGWGGFNRAWTLTPFPDRPIAFFDHCHNLPLQIVAELGWLLGGAVLGALAWALWRCAVIAWRAAGEGAVQRRAPLMLLLVVGAHSLLEYPLWYAYFLLPTACALGLCLAADAEPGSASARSFPLWPRWVGLCLVLGSAFALWEYGRVVAIYAPKAQAQALAVRVAAGQSTVFFSAQADYAAATALGYDAEALAAASRTGHHLIDARLLMAWAKNLHAVGEVDRARFMVARLREFRSREGRAWLAECDTNPALWQCTPPAQHYDWRSF
jgi:O-antigen ligase